MGPFVDGTGSRSVDSTSTGQSKHSVKSKIRKRVTNIRTMLGMGERCSDASMQLHPETNFTSAATYLLANDSNTTTVHHPLKLRLTAIPDIPEGDSNNSASPFAKSTPISPRPYSRLGENDDLAPGFLNINQCGKDTGMSQSAPGLQRRMSQMFRQSFGNGNSTVVKRSSLRSRPSVQALAMESAAATSTQLSSTPSTFNSGGSFWGTDRHGSTPMTSAPVTPESIVRYGSMGSFDTERQAFMTESRLLTPIPETSSLLTFTVQTVEAAATAKMHLELHFNSLFNGTSSRSLRHRELEMKLKDVWLPLESQNRAQQAWEKAETENLRQRRVLMNTTNHAKASEGISPGGFEVVSVLGKGSFGVVRLVRVQGSKNEGGAAAGRSSGKLPATKSARSSLLSSAKMLSAPLLSRRKTSITAKQEVYAMKVIRKSDMVRNGQEGHLRAERDFLVAAEGSRWIIPLIAAFQDRKHLYLVMEYCIGGDFLGLLIRKNTLNEAITKWYVAEMVLCVEEAHRMRWIHRDVKPDNFLIALDGHLKISDFGLAFDGDWSHDQRFYHMNRHSLLDELGISVDGDEQDRKEKQAQHHAEKKHGKDDSISRETPRIREPILDFRNRSQRRRLARSVVGTSQYMAPEVIRGDMYDGRCD